jgi:predicted DNA-binding transcriptional regulator AlpA
MKEIDPLLPARDVCRALAISRITLHRWVTDGRFPPPLHNGPRNYWRASTVQAFIDALEPGPKRRIRLNEPAHCTRVRS